MVTKFFVHMVMTFVERASAPCAQLKRAPISLWISHRALFALDDMRQASGVPVTKLVDAALRDAGRHAATIAENVRGQPPVYLRTQRMLTLDTRTVAALRRMKAETGLSISRFVEAALYAHPTARRFIDRQPQ